LLFIDSYLYDEINALKKLKVWCNHMCKNKMEARKWVSC